ncbi:MAG: hypothetical protein ACLFTZ_00525 [Acholeplasmataceae bacterium]
MKLLFKLIVLPIIISLIIPVALLAIVYKDVSIPTTDFEASEEVELTAMVNDEFDRFLADEDENAAIALDFDQKRANSVLLSALREQNEFYLNEDAESDDIRNYVIKEDNYGYQGSWIRFRDDTIEIESGIHVFVAGVTYRTSILMAFELTMDTSEVVLKLDEFNLGNLPLAWSFNTLGWGLEQFGGTDIDALLQDQTGDALSFDSDERTLRLDVDELLAQSFEDDPETYSMVNALLRFIDDNELLDLSVRDESIGTSLRLGRMMDETEPFVLDEEDKIRDDAHMQQILASRGSSLLFSTLDTGSENPYLELDAFTLNRIFEYMMRDQLAEEGIVQRIELIENYEMVARVPYVTIGEGLVVHIPIEIMRVDDPDQSFRSIIRINTAPSMDGKDLRLEIIDLAAGQVTLEGDDVSEILGMLGDNELIEDGAFVIRDFDEQMDQSGMAIEDVRIAEQRLRISVELSDLPSEEIQEVAQEVIEDVRSDLEFDEDYAEVNDAIDDLLAEAEDPEGDTTEAIDDLLDSFEELEDDEQEELFTQLQESFEEVDTEGYSFEDLFDFMND